MFKRTKRQSPCTTTICSYATQCCGWASMPCRKPDPPDRPAARCPPVTIPLSLTEEIMRCLATVVLLCAVMPAYAEDPAPIRITLHPAPPSSSALKYRLLPELRDMQTGNAV